MATSQLTRLVVGIFAALLVAGPLLQTFAQEVPKSRPATEMSIAEILQIRRAVLAELVKVRTEAYHQGKVGVEAVIQAHRELQLVELELAGNHHERIELLEESVQLAGGLERITDAKFKAGEASAGDVLKSRADRLRAETDLLRERQIRQGHSHDGGHGQNRQEQGDGHEHASEQHDRGAARDEHKHSSDAQQPAGLSESKTTESPDFEMPESLRLRHEAFRAEFVRATKERGKVGETARAIENLGNAHFAKAKDVFPALGLLPLLAEGRVTPEMAEAARIADDLRASLPQIRQEHRELVAGLKKIAAAARQDAKTEYAGFAERLVWHIQEEEEVLYPTVLLVGEVVKSKLEHK